VFEALTERLEQAFSRLRGRGKVRERDVDEALREVRLALLEADVSVDVTRDFLARIRERAVNQEVLQSLTPVQQVVKIVYEELVHLMGEARADVLWSKTPPTVIFLVGLQGTGKTTTAAKLAYHFLREGRTPLLVGADVYRPAAREQLETMGKKAGVPVYTRYDVNDALRIAREGVEYARRDGYDVVLVDTAGRLHVDEELMAELERMKGELSPHEIFFTLDAMAGQDAVRVAREFHERLALTGIVVTKLDGDSRGGAVLSVRAVTGAPVKFVAVGEKLEDLEAFYPERMAQRILGMGDVLTLIEKAERELDERRAAELERKMREATFDLEDFLEQLRSLRRMGPLDELLKLIPGVGGALRGVSVDERELRHLEAIVLSMTTDERRRPEIVNFSRRKRIAQGSGTSVQDVNRLLKQFETMRKLMKQMSRSGGKKGRLPDVGGLDDLSGLLGGEGGFPFASGKSKKGKRKFWR